MAQYGKSEYWEDRYQKDKEPFDWYQRYGGGLKDIITQYVQPNCQILNIGAGNSRKLHKSRFCTPHIPQCPIFEFSYLFLA